MTAPRIDQAFELYQDLLASSEAIRVIGTERGFGHPAIHPDNWELFGAELLDLHRGSGHADLDGVEVKSTAATATGVEYQYHRKTGLQKLAEDKHSHHLFIIYGNGNRDVDVLLMQPADFHAYVSDSGWRREVLAKYYRGFDPITGKHVIKKDDGLRCRRSMPLGYIRDYAQPVLTIRDGEIVEFCDMQLEWLLKLDPACAACADDMALPLNLEQVA